MRNHIIVVGMHTSIESFITPLRSRFLKEHQLQKIVIITGELKDEALVKIEQHLFNKIRQYKDVYRIIGSPLNQETYLKANINYADKVVILGVDTSLKRDLNDEMLDAESIFIYKAIKKCNSNIQIITELYYQSNIDFLMPNLQSNGQAID